MQSSPVVRGNVSDVKSLCQYKIWKRIWKKNLLTHLCARRGARLVFIVPSAINPPFANNIGMNLILITALGSLPRPRLHVIRFQGRAGAERHLP